MNKCKVCGMPHKKKLINKEEFIKNANKINKPMIERVELTDFGWKTKINNEEYVARDLEDGSLICRLKLNEIIDWINNYEK